MDNRNIFLIDKNKNHSRHSVEELHSLKLNQWKGWECSAGLRTLYIDFDGNVWRATCGEGGWIGNINNPTGPISLRQLTDRSWIKCSKTTCACGADMVISKVKNAEDKLKYFNKDGKLATNIIENDRLDYDAVYSAETEKFKTVTWDLGRLCNFDCHYCSKNSHNSFDPVKNLKFFLNAYENIKRWNVSKERIKFAMTGGEPTVYKDYLPFIKILKEEDHIIHTTTNGSNTEKYYAELAEYSDVAFSIHLEYVKRLGLEKFIENIKSAAETTEKGHRENTNARFNWVIVRIMLDPGNLETAKLLHSLLKEELKDYRNFVLTVDTVHVADVDHKSPGKVLYEYSQEETDWLQEIHKNS